MSKERPIPFKAAMVRALLDGSKTQTRRVVKPQPTMYEPGQCVAVSDMINDQLVCPYGQRGDRLWVRETWVEDPEDDGTWHYTQYMGCKGSPLSDIPKRFQKPDHCIFRADWDGHDMVWRPSIHMPRWASRILLEVVSVRVERLNAISDNDCYEEGAQAWAAETVKPGEKYSSIRAAYRALWEQINGAGSWDANPWVWVVEFKRVVPC